MDELTKVAEELHRIGDAIYFAVVIISFLTCTIVISLGAITRAIIRSKQ